MRTALVATCIAVTAGLLAACQTCTDPTPWPVRANEPLGARCERDGQCAPGLVCLDSTCTVDCSAGPGACPTGATCFFARYCLPSCADDLDCVMGHTLGACAGPPATDPPYCYQRSCGSDAECPGGRCAGLSLAGGITWNQECSSGTCVVDLPP